MKIRYISEDDLNAIKSNLDNVLKRVVHNNEDLSTLFNNSNFIKESSIEISDFQLDMSQPKGNESLTDIENVQRVYNHMKCLSDSQASDERVWTAYTLDTFLEYMRYRWPAKQTDDIKNRYLYGYSTQRSLFRNGIARLWWIGRFSYDAGRADPYELTKFLCKEQDYIESICGRNIFNNPIIGRSVIIALMEAERGGKKVNREMVREVGKYANLLAGTYLLDSMEQDEIIEKVAEKIELL